MRRCLCQRICLAVALVSWVILINEVLQDIAVYVDIDQAVHVPVTSANVHPGINLAQNAKAEDDRKITV